MKSRNLIKNQKLLNFLSILILIQEYQPIWPLLIMKLNYFDRYKDRNIFRN